MLDLSHLNPQQKEAVETTDGPLLVLAGAGSGKTSVLTHRIAYILDSGLAGPDNILAMTFTNKAAGEMKERIVRILKDNAKQNKNEISAPYWMGTFHSIGVRILKIYGDRIGIDRNFSIYDSSDQLATTKEAMEKLRISTKEVNPRAIHGYISSAKNELIGPREYSTLAQGYFQKTASDVYFEYQKILKDNNSLDFDDLILKTYKLLNKDEEVLKKFQNQFKYILVDEYQDTNHAQYKLIKMFAEQYKNICCVGDDDQSIYSFRGATVQNILNFERDYPDSKVIKLEQNYRSTKKILEASYQVISQNRSRKDKKLWTENDDGAEIVLYTANDEKDEASWITEMIEQNAEDNNYEKFAVLYRTNSQSRTLEEAFVNYGIPYRIVGGVRFYERKEIKDILAYLKLIFNPKDSKNLERIINVPRRGIGKKSYADFLELGRNSNLSGAETFLNSDLQVLNAKVESFGKIYRALVEKSKEMHIVDFMHYLLEKTGYFQMLDDGTSENADRLENIKELISVASKFNDLEPAEALEAFLDEVSLLEGVATAEDQTNVVTLMTIHSSKGLEYPHIFVVGMEENLFPHSNSMFNEKELEEERRLAYVAITRAKNNLYLTHAASRIYFGKLNSNPVSRFIEDIDPTLVNHIKAENTDGWKGDYNKSNNNRSYFDKAINKTANVSLGKGDKVKHEYFGEGVVKYIDDEMMTIDFGKEYGEKELMLEYARVEKVN